MVKVVYFILLGFALASTQFELSEQVTCSDIPPDSNYTCAQQKSWGKCSASFMEGYCCQTCHNCQGTSCTPSPNKCSDIPPDSNYTCAQQKSFGKCSADFMVGYCCQTCHNCEGTGCASPGKCSDIPPDNQYTCAQQKEWGKCSWDFMIGHCCQTCFDCEGHGCSPAPPPPPGAWSATATHYSPAQGGTAVCGSEGGYCGAPSDGSEFWEGDKCQCEGSDPTCSKGVCYDCHGANECRSECPPCPTTNCGKHLKVTCTDPDGHGYCNDTKCVVIKVTNACPQYNPCNSCKGDENPCRAGVNHIDLCDQSFNVIADGSKQPAEGIKIYVEKTSDPEGPCSS